MTPSGNPFILNVVSSGSLGALTYSSTIHTHDGTRWNSLTGPAGMFNAERPLFDSNGNYVVYGENTGGTRESPYAVFRHDGTNWSRVAGPTSDRGTILVDSEDRVLLREQSRLYRLTGTTWDSGVAYPAGRGRINWSVLDSNDVFYLMTAGGVWSITL